MKKIRRVPTILGVFLLLFAIIGGVIAVRQGSSWFLRAEPDTTPKEVKISNVTESSFSVSWITPKQTTGFVKYGDNGSLTLTADDDRDQASQKEGQYFTHYVTLTNLDPDKTYSFKVAANGKLFDNNDQPFESLTGPEIKTPPPPNDMVHGRVEKVDGTPASGAIVYLTLANTGLQSALVKNSSDWVIPLSLARTANLNNYATYDRKASVEEIFVQAGSEGTSTAKATTNQDSPLPTIILGKNADFTESLVDQEEENIPSLTQIKDEVIKNKDEIEIPNEEEDEDNEIEEIDEDEDDEASSSADSPGSKFNLNDDDSPSPKDKLLTIINPTQEEEINTTEPAFIGTAPAGKKIIVVVESSNPQTGQVIVDENGEWEWSPPEGLEPGEHTITASYTDDQGILKEIKRTFMVLAAEGDDLPAIEATPSATLTPTTTLTPTPTTSPRTSVPSTASGVPQSGSLTPTLILLIMGLSLITFSFLVYPFLKRKTA